MYILWADDNGSGTPDNAIEIDNFSVSFPGVAPTIAQQPVSTNVLQCHSTSFTAEAQGSAPLVYRWFHGATAIDTTVNPSAGTPTLVITNAQSSDGGQYHVHVSNGVGPGVDSSTVTLTVNPDTQPPALIFAIGKADLVTVVVTFSEPVATTGPDNGAQDAFSYLVQTPGGGTALGVNSAVLNNETNVTLTLGDARDPALNYEVVIVGDIQDTCAHNSIPLNSTIAVSPEFSFQQGDINGYSGTQDTELRSSNPDVVQGARTDYINIDLSDVLAGDPNPAGPVQGLFRFDNIIGNNPGQIPPGATILKGNLTFFSSAANANGNPVNMYRMLVDWDQNTATWNSMVNGVTNDDVEAESTPTASWDTALTVPFQITVDVTRSIDQWAQGAPNYGWAILPTGGDGYRIDPSESPTAANRPLLEVTYTLLCLSVGFEQQPVAQQGINEGQPFSISCVVTGSAPQLQWYLNNTAIPGATEPTYGKAFSTRADAGTYYCIASNHCTSGASSIQKSANSVLVITNDTTAPLFLSAVGLVDASHILVTYSETLGTTGPNAPSVGAFHLSPSLGALTLTVTNGSNVLITTASPRIAGSHYRLGMDAGAVHDPFGNASAATNVLIISDVGIITLDDGRPWRYSADGTDQGTAWQATGFNDSGWPSGQTLFDGKTGATAGRTTLNGEAIRTMLIITNLNCGKTTNTDIPTFYFRTHFNYAAGGGRLKVRPFIDDSAILYINGVEVGRVGLTNGPVIPFCNYGADFGGRSVGDANFDPDLAISNSSLVSGDNVLAVEVKQVNATSSDITFGLDLIADPELTIAAVSASQVRVSWAGGGTLQSSTDLKTWTDVAGAAPPSLLVSVTTSHTFYRLRP
jgi:hypothetical protein